MTPSEALILAIYREELWHDRKPHQAARQTASRCGVELDRVSSIAQAAGRQAFVRIVDKYKRSLGAK